MEYWRTAHIPRWSFVTLGVRVKSDAFFGVGTMSREVVPAAAVSDPGVLRVDFLRALKNVAGRRDCCLEVRLRRSIVPEGFADVLAFGLGVRGRQMTRDSWVQCCLWLIGLSACERGRRR